MPLARMRVEVKADCAQDARRVHDVADDRALTPQALLVPLHLVLAVRQSDRPRAEYRPARQHCVAVERQTVLALRAALKPAALTQIDVAGREGVSRAERARKLARHVQVARARHAVVQLCQKQYVALRHQRVLGEDSGYAFEPLAALDVPSGRAYRARVRRFARARAREVAALDAAEHALDLRAQTRVERRRFQFLRRMK